MKRLILAAFAVVMLVSTGCSIKQVPPGTLGVKVHMTGGAKGVDQETVSVGYQFLTINEKLFLFPVYKQNYTWTKSPQEGRPADESISFQTKEGLEVNGDFGITYQVEPTKVTTLFIKYRTGLEEITDTYLRNYVRDAINEEASKMAVEETYGSGKGDLLRKVEARVRAQMEPEGIKVEKIYLIGQFRLPAAVLNALNLKITATQIAQQRQNEVMEAEAQARKDVAQAEGQAKAKLAIARAEATANELKNKTINENLIRFEFARRWNGEMPVVMGGGSMPMFNIQDMMKSRAAGKAQAGE